MVVVVFVSFLYIRLFVHILHILGEGGKMEGLVLERGGFLSAFPFSFWYRSFPV